MWLNDHSDDLWQILGDSNENLITENIVTLMQLNNEIIKELNNNEMDNEMDNFINWLCEQLFITGPIGYNTKFLIDGNINLLIS